MLPNSSAFLFLRERVTCHVSKKYISLGWNEVPNHFPNEPRQVLCASRAKITVPFGSLSVIKCVSNESCHAGFYVSCYFETRVLFLTGTLAVLPPGQNGVVQDGNPIAWISKEINLHDMECSMYSLHVINKLKSRKKFVKSLALFDQKRMYLFPSPWLGCSLAIGTRKRSSFN